MRKLQLVGQSRRFPLLTSSISRVQLTNETWTSISPEHCSAGWVV